MNDLNVVILTGRLTRDPEKKETRAGTSLCTFSLAVNRYFKRQTGGEWGEETSYVEVTAWGLLASRCGDHLQKGARARVQGYLKQERWQDGHGTNHSKLVIVAEKVDWASAKPEQPEEKTVDAEPAPHELQPELED